MSDASSHGSRDMLSHAGGHTAPGTLHGTPPRTQKEPWPQLDAVSIAFAALLLIGLIALALAVWLIFTLPSRGQGTSAVASPRMLRAAQTSEAYRAEIARLEAELGQARQQAATAAANALPAATSAPVASTVLDKPPLALILDVPVYKQNHSLSCESSAAAMATSFHGLGIGEEAILAALPRHDNPHKGFRGNVDGPYGGVVDYGVYAEPVRQVLASWGLEVEPLVGGVQEIRSQIRRGRPVIAWVTYNLQVQSPTQAATSDGQIVTLVPYEHTVLVTGYNRDGLWVNDPYSGVQTFYSEAEFARAFSYLGNMGLVVGPPVNR